MSVDQKMDCGRRNLLLATSAVGGVAAVATAVPFVASLTPSERAKAAGAPVVKGGSAAAVGAFASLIAEKGGEIRTDADVECILVEGGKVTGVRLTTGEEIMANSVLASVAPGQLYGRLLDHLQLPEDKAAAQTFRHGRGNFQLHFALDRHPEWLTPGLDDVALIHLADSIDSVSKSANEAERGMFPETPTICVGQPHRLDPTRAPDGKAVLWLQIPDAPRTIKGDAAGEIEGRDWDEATREAFADRIEAILARHIKDFSTIKLARRAYSPADLAAMNMNLVGGDPYGGACSIDQFFIWRPFAHSGKGDLKVRGSGGNVRGGCLGGFASDHVVHGASLAAAGVDRGGAGIVRIRACWGGAVVGVRSVPAVAVHCRGDGFDLDRGRVRGVRIRSAGDGGHGGGAVGLAADHGVDQVQRDRRGVGARGGDGRGCAEDRGVGARGAGVVRRGSRDGGDHAGGW
mgnify:CR=1 FL=1